MAFASVSVGCASTNHMQVGDDVWIAKQNQFLIFSWSDIFFCRATKLDEKRKAAPVCYEAEILKHRPQ